MSEPTEPANTNQLGDTHAHVKMSEPTETGMRAGISTASKKPVDPEKHGVAGYHKGDSYLPAQRELAIRRETAAAHRYSPTESQIVSQMLTMDTNWHLYTEVLLNLPIARTLRVAAAIDATRPLMRRMNVLGTYHVEPNQLVRAAQSEKTYPERLTEGVASLFNTRSLSAPVLNASLYTTTELGLEIPHSAINKDCPFHVPGPIRQEDIWTPEENEYWAQAVGGKPYIRYPPKSTLNDLPATFGITWRVRQFEEEEEVLTAGALARKLVRERRHPVSEVELLLKEINNKQERAPAVVPQRDRPVYFASVEDFNVAHQARMKAAAFKGLPPPFTGGFIGRHATVETDSKYLCKGGFPTPRYLAELKIAEVQRHRLDVPGAIRVPAGPPQPKNHPPKHWKKLERNPRMREIYQEMEDEWDIERQALKGIVPLKDPLEELAIAKNGKDLRRKAGVKAYKEGRDGMPGPYNRIDNDYQLPRDVRDHWARKGATDQPPPRPTVYIEPYVDKRGRLIDFDDSRKAARRQVVRRPSIRKPLPVVEYHPRPDTSSPVEKSSLVEESSLVKESSLVEESSQVEKSDVFEGSGEDAVIDDEAEIDDDEEDLGRRYTTEEKGKWVER